MAVTQPEAAHILGCSVSQICSLIAVGELWPAPSRALVEEGSEYA
jgi:hypothetical protein